LRSAVLALTTTDSDLKLERRNKIFISASRVVRLLFAKCEMKQSSGKGGLEYKKSSENT
jgi:hypothetical protein